MGFVERIIEEFGRLANAELLRRLDSLEAEMLSQFDLLVEPTRKPDRPPPITTWRAIAERKDNEMWLITFEADLPPVADTPNNVDVELHRIKVLIDGVEHSSQDLPRLAEKVTFEVPKGANVMLRGSYVDDDDNEGPFVESEMFVASDTVPPDAPGSFGEIRNLGEREVPDEA